MRTCSKHVTLLLTFSVIYVLICTVSPSYARTSDSDAGYIFYKGNSFYEEGNYDRILGYIEDEAEDFIESYRILKREMPKLRAHLKR